MAASSARQSQIHTRDGTNAHSAACSRPSILAAETDCRLSRRRVRRRQCSVRHDERSSGARPACALCPWPMRMAVRNRHRTAARSRCLTSHLVAVPWKLCTCKGFQHSVLLVAEPAHSPGLSTISSHVFHSLAMSSMTLQVSFSCIFCASSRSKSLRHTRTICGTRWQTHVCLAQAMCCGIRSDNPSISIFKYCRVVCEFVRGQFAATQETAGNPELWQPAQVPGVRWEPFSASLLPPYLYYST